MNILHVFYSTLPSTTGGDIRSRDIIESQAQVGLEVYAISSPFQPPAKMGAKVESFNGINYHRSYDYTAGLQISERDQGLMVKLRKALRIFYFTDEILALCSKKKPDVIHAHSTFFCAFAAKRAARRLGIPMVYEVRSLWERRSTMKSESLKARFVAYFIRWLETKAMHMADGIVTISNGLRQNIISRGISENQVTLVRNAVNFTRVPENVASIDSKPTPQWVFGYVGNLSDIEGLDLLIQAVANLRKQGWNNTIIFHGDGPAKTKLQHKAKGIENIFFKGRFEPENVARIYETLDVVVNPRRRSPLTDTVTPLKPLEAMAYLKPVITSSVSGMLELVSDGKTGFVFEADNVDDLAKTIIRLTDNYQTALYVTSAARQFVFENRSWYANGIVYKELYKKMQRL